MSDAGKDVAAGYGEDDIEAKAMDKAAATAPASGPGAPPPNTLIPAAGTTETDIAKNLRAKADRESKS